MASNFHWIRVKAICYATEDEDLICDVVSAMTGAEELDIDISEGLHNNPLTVVDANLTKNKEFATVFRTLGKDIVDQILESIEDRVDDDCVFYVRFDKQKAVCGEYEITHGGDVISLTAKIMSHPARKEVAVGVLRDYLRNLFPQDSPQ
ncbi:MAG: exosome protein [Thermoplasmata archaeon]|nr:exosome protein [Thermoplasmata archaeon]